MYDPIPNSWTVTKPFTGTGRVNAAGFALNGRAYIGTGVYDSGGGNLVVVNDFWEYVPQVFE
jgi:hypothetical protein